MSSIGTALLNSLRSVKRSGDFCVGGTREIFMPTIDVDGVGRMAFPILPIQGEQLVAIAEAAPFGRGEATVVDREVRRTWQVDADKVRIGGRHWDKTLAGLVADVARELGVSEPVEADFYKLLVCDTGSFFVDHRDTEKVPGMFATMVLVMPSDHRGGELVVKHLGREVVIDPRMSSKAFAARRATSTSPPKGVAVPTRWSPRRTRPATNDAQGSAGRIWRMCRRWVDEDALVSHGTARFMTG
jgi:hypothetical protein